MAYTRIAKNAPKNALITKGFMSGIFTICPTDVRAKPIKKPMTKAITFIVNSFSVLIRWQILPVKYTLELTNELVNSELYFNSCYSL